MSAMKGVHRFPRVRVAPSWLLRASLATIISYPTSTSGIIVFIKNAHEISRILPDIIFVKTKDFQLVF